LKYKPLFEGNLQDRENNSNIEVTVLEAFLTKNKGYSPGIANKAIAELKKAATMASTDELYTVNKEVYHLLRYGVRVRQDVTENPQTVHFIDWENPGNNEFNYAEEVTVKDRKEKRPDIVLYVNGIALAIFELKRASVNVTQGIRQNLDNQSDRFIKSFFSTIQLVLAGNDSQGLWYGTTKTPEKFFLKWKEDNYNYNPDTNLLDQHVLQFCHPDRLLEIIHDFVLFDGGIKKLSRPNQYFGVRAAREYVKSRKGGIIWHTQGSGKSLTMVWLAKWIREHIENSRVLIVTDRTELDEQIEKVFLGVEEKIFRCKKSGAQSGGEVLIDTLNSTSPWLFCSLIHKFGGKEDETDVTGFVKDLKSKIPKDFSPKGNLFVYVDECHRSNSGFLHEAMKSILPEAVFLGFTGTPLLKTDKRKSIEIFGPYIHTYRFDEAVKDGVVLDLLYEARDVDQHVLDQKGIDQWFEEVTKGMNDIPKAELKKQWGTMQKVLSTKSRLEKIVFDIIKDFKIKPRLKDGRGNALLVSRSIYEACRYYELFQHFGFKKCAIITSFEPTASSTRGEETGEGETEKVEQFETYQRMLNGKDREEFEKEVKKKFIDEPANMQLLIVVDKLLTGFDAPPCTYLYIDKEMQDQGLFQAICRVNRTEEEDKEFGYIVDYKNLFASGKLEAAIKDYTSGAFDKFAKEDIDGLLTDRLEKAKERLEETLETVHQLCVPVEAPKQIEQYIKYFCGNTEDKDALKENEEKRLTYYKAVVALIRAYNNIAPEMIAAGYTQEEFDKIKKQVEDHTEMRNAIKIASFDDIDLKRYEPEMRQLLDMYLTADASRTISNFGDTSLLNLIVDSGIQAGLDKLPEKIKSSTTSVAETLEANMRKVITQEMPMNPMYYERMSVLLEELIRQRKEEALKYEDLLKQYEELAKKLYPHTSDQYPQSVNTSGKRALYDNLEKNEELTDELYRVINTDRPDGWVGVTMKERRVRNAIREPLERYGITDEKKISGLMEIIANQQEFQ
jgi:type I restriction enzyme R subunit